MIAIDGKTKSGAMAGPTYDDEDYKIVIDLPFLDRAKQYRSRCPGKRFRSLPIARANEKIKAAILTA